MKLPTHRRTFFSPKILLGLTYFFIIFFLFHSLSFAGNGANFVVYDHHTNEKGETEAQIYNDLGRLQDGKNYTAQLLELEYGITDKWMTAAYLESHALIGDDWSFDGFRWSTRYRLFDYGTPLNPVLYMEYVNVKESALYILEVVGRTDDGEQGEDPKDEENNKRENEIDTKLILGHDFADNLRYGFNWINATNLKTGNWNFGYATGLTYTFFETEAKDTKAHFFNVKEMQLGLEFYGGLGDSDKGLTLSGNVTEHYAGLNLKTEFSNKSKFMLGGAFGLTDASRDAILRANIGIELN